jgi:hypothetical protein
MSCTTEIPPNWVACIQKNICPACGGSILDESGEELLKELTDAMESMPNDPAGIAGWLLSNYHFRKIGSAEPVEEFYGRKKSKKAKVQTEDDDEESDNEVLQTDSFSKIWKNAKVKPMGKSQLKSKLEANVEKILENQYGSADDEEEPFSSESYDEEDLENVDLSSEADDSSFLDSFQDDRLSKLLKQEKSLNSMSGAFSRK